jgi:hypothetical protein
MTSPTIFITTGPESSGKTTLASALSSALHAPLVSEMSRDYLNARYQKQPDYQYQPADLLQIAQQQHAAEQQMLAANPALLVCDTDLLVIIIWSQVKYGHVDPWIIATFNASLQSTQRHYLLCDHNIPWQYDPLRENPHDRHVLAARYRDTLHDLGCTSLTVSGTQPERLAASVAWLEGISGLRHLP